MTTIAYSAKHKQIAGDRRVTRGIEVMGVVSEPKVLENRTHLFGFAGDLRIVKTVRDALDEIAAFRHQEALEEFFHDILPSLEGHLEVVCIDKKKPLIATRAATADRDMDIATVSLKDTGGLVSIGSGRKFALGAMSVGAEPKDAIRAVQKFDLMTGGGVDSIVF